MTVIHIHTRIDSETLHLPELKPFIGKTVEIIVREEDAPQVSAARNWEAAEQAIRELKDYDFDAYRDQREFDRRHANDHLP